LYFLAEIVCLFIHSESVILFIHEHI
jgi:hypothetical protein